MDINLVPKFVDKAMSPVAESVGNSVADLWTVTFGNHVNLWKQKQDYKHELNYQDYVERVNSKLEKIPSEKFKEPSLHIIGPAIEASKFYIDSEELREMFANLITASMNEDKTLSVHPSYVEIIKQLSPDEAKILSYMKRKDFPFYNVHAHQGGDQYLTVMRHFSIVGFQSNCKIPENITIYLDNLNRLGLITLDATRYIQDPTVYAEIEDNEFFKGAIDYIGPIGELKTQKGIIESTAFGANFYHSCIE